MRILIVVHGFPPKAHGGTELYAEAHARTLAAGGDTVLVLARESNAARPEYTVREEDREGYRVAWVNHTFRESVTVDEAWRAPRLEAAVSPVFEAFAPDVAHVHHLTCLSTLIPSMLASRGVPVVMTLHDYWLMCHRGQLLDTSGTRCEGSGATGCARCIQAPPLAERAATIVGRALHEVDRASPSVGRTVRDVLKAGSQALATDEASRGVSLRRTRHVREEVLPHVAMFLSPSAHVEQRFVQFGVPPDRIRVSPYGLSPVPQPLPLARSAGPLRVGYVGSLMLSKAPHVAMEAVAALPAATATLDVYGEFAAYHGDRRYGGVIDRAAAHPAITRHGSIEHSKIAEVLSWLDVLVVPSTWEENQPFVILEAFRAGVPVVASRVGGIPEIVQDRVNGVLVEPGDVAGFASALGALASDRSSLARLRTGIPAVRSLDDAVAEMRALYVELAAPARPNAPTAPEVSAAIRSVAAVVLHHGTPGETALAVRALRAAAAPVNRVVVVNNDDEPRVLDVGTVGLPVSQLVTGRNLGFPGGMNAGIRHALDHGADAVLLVNSDVVVPPATARALTLALEAHPAAGIAAPVVLARERPSDIASLGIRFNRVTGRMRNLGGAGQPLRSVPAWQAVDAANGCALLVSRAVFERVGLFDERYFFSFEEIEFCVRARDAGFQPGVAGGAVVYHQGAATLAAVSPRRFYFAARNHLALASSAGRPGGVIASAARSTFVTFLNIGHALVAPGGRRLARLRATLRGVNDYRRGRFGRDAHTGG